MSAVKSVFISVYPKKLTYYIGEEFDPTGISVQVNFEDGSTTFIEDPSQLTFEGFDSSVPCEEQEIKVSYMGVSTTMSMVIKEWPTADPVLVRIEVKDLKTTYDLAYWNKYRLGSYTEHASIDCIYSDGSVVNVPLLRKYIYDAKKVDSPRTLYITIKYSTVETQVEITITATLKYTKLSRGIFTTSINGRHFRKLTTTS